MSDQLAHRPANLCDRCQKVTPRRYHRITVSGTMKSERTWWLCEPCWLLLVAIIQDELLNGTAWGKRLLEEQHKRNEALRRPGRTKADP